MEDPSMSKSQQSGQTGSRHAASAMVVALLGCGAGLAQAQVPGADFYLGAAVGQGKVAAQDADLGYRQFKDDHTAFKVYAGVRAASLLGAEIAYMDFGKASDTLGGTQARGKLKGIAAFGLLYLPLPVPVLDVYAKAGFAHLDTKITTGSVKLLSTKEEDFAYGAGVQVKLGSFAIRGEYERFANDGTDPALLSIGFTKFFL
jgi:hypothetical protein